MNSETHPSLLERLRDGADRMAWHEFFNRYWRLSFALAKHYGCSDDTADDMVQQVMLAVFRKKDVFRYDPDKGRFRGWLAAIVRRQVAAHRRGAAKPALVQGNQPRRRDEKHPYPRRRSRTPRNPG